MVRLMVKVFFSPVTGLVVKGFAFEILSPSAHELGILQRAFHALYLVFAWCHAKHKRCSAPFKSVCPFLLRRPKEMDERKGRRCAVLVARIPRTGFAGCCGRAS